MAKGFKTGGRKKGTPNKRPEGFRVMIEEFVRHYSSLPDGVSLMYQDFLSLEPKDRIMIAEKLFQYVLPKYQAIEASFEGEHKVSIEDKLMELAKVPGIDD